MRNDRTFEHIAFSRLSIGHSFIYYSWISLSLHPHTALTGFAFSYHLVTFLLQTVSEVLVFTEPVYDIFILI